MLHLRISAPTRLSDAVVQVLSDDPAVSSLAALRGASVNPPGDLILAEQGATIGFAGRRVIEQTLRQKLPAGFQSAETVFAQGQIDQIVHRHHLRQTIALLLSLHGRPA